jgi:hypothetical protein
MQGRLPKYEGRNIWIQLPWSCSEHHKSRFSAVVEECWGRGEEGRGAELTCYFIIAHHTLTTVPARQLPCWSVVRVPEMDSKQEVISKV